MRCTTTMSSRRRPLRSGALARTRPSSRAKAWPLSLSPPSSHGSGRLMSSQTTAKTHPRHPLEDWRDCHMQIYIVKNNKKKKKRWAGRADPALRRFRGRWIRQKPFCINRKKTRKKKSSTGRDCITDRTSIIFFLFSFFSLWLFCFIFLGENNILRCSMSAWTNKTRWINWEVQARRHEKGTFCDYVSIFLCFKHGDTIQVILLNDWGQKNKTDMR